MAYWQNKKSFYYDKMPSQYDNMASYQDKVALYADKMPLYTKGNRTIRFAEPEDVPRIMELIECGRQKMRAAGNMEQWTDGNPKQEVIENDIARGDSYLMEEDGKPIATFAFVEGQDITYNQIYEGKWLDDLQPYHVIHRIASAPDVHGVLRDVLDYCFRRTNNIRIDTHRDNTPMRNALQKYNFGYCGIIYLLDGAERLAYQRINL